MLEATKNLFSRKEKANIGPPLGEVDPLSQGQTFTMMAHSTPPTPGTHELLRIYSQSPKVRGMFNKIATNVAKTAWRVFVPRDTSGRAVRNKALASMDFQNRQKTLDDLIENNQVEEITDHPLLDVLTEGNDELVGFTNLQVTQTHIDLIGEGFWLKERNNAGRVIELWPLPPHWIRALPTGNHPFFQISAIGYSGAAAVDVPVTEIIYFRDPDPANPYGRGSGLGKSLGDETQIDEFSAKYINSFFFNRARPDIIISGENLSKENTKRLEEMWLQKQQGFWNCHDEETEILTKNGWKLGIDLDYQDEIATHNTETGKLEYQKPTDIYKYEYSGHLNFWENRRINALVTPNHRMLLYRGHSNYWHDDWHFEYSENAMERGGSINFLLAGEYEGNKTTVKIPSVEYSRCGRPPKGLNNKIVFRTEDFAPLLGYIISEGNIQPSRLTIVQSSINPESVAKIDKAIDNTFPSEYVHKCTVPSVDEGSEKSIYRWRITHKGFATWCLEHINSGSGNKRIPKEVFEWDKKAKIILLEALIDGDGSWRKGKEQSAIYATISKGLADDMQRLCIEVGYRCNLKHRLSKTPVHEYNTGDGRRTLVEGAKRDCWYWQVAISKRKEANWEKNKNKNASMKEVPYEGIVWCASVPNQTMFTRRKGKVLVSGNSFKPAFLSRSVDVKVISQNMEQMQMVELRKHEREVFLNTIGAPPEIWGQLTSSNRCHDDQTECLTKAGWKTYDQLTHDDEIATFNPELEALEYHKPEAIHTYDYNGVMHHWTGRRFDCMVTPNHKMYWRPCEGSGGKYTTFTSEQLKNKAPSTDIYWRVTGGNYTNNKTTVKIPKIDKMHGIRHKKEEEYVLPKEASKETLDLSVNDFAEFLGYWISEGSVSQSDQTKRRSYGIRLSQNSGDLADKMENNMEKLFPYKNICKTKTTKDRKSEATTLMVCDKSLWFWLKDNVGFGCHNKRLPEECFDWTTEGKLTLLNALMDGDGHWSTQYKYNDCYYSTSSKNLADDVQKLCLEIGLRAKVRTKISKYDDKYLKGMKNMAGKEYVMYEVTISEKQELVVKSNFCEEIQYQGKIWCVTVPNNLFFTRRNGIVALHHNSTISSADYFLQKFVIQPRMEFLRAHLQKRLIPDFDSRLILDYHSPIKEDEEFELSVMKAAPWSASINEWRHKANLSNKEDGSGDLHMVPMNETLTDLNDLDSEPAPDDDTKNYLEVEKQLEQAMRKRLKVKGN